jgi:hypothetical protein
VPRGTTAVVEMHPVGRTGGGVAHTSSCS